MRQALVSGVRLPEKERERVKTLIEMGYYMNFADFLRDAVRSKLEEFEFAFVREVDVKTAKKEIVEYIKKNPNVYADEIARDLNMDAETVIKAVHELIEEKKLEESR
jgi:Arc/MetJ-type ribon-helix-helix transcriptional regulator